MTVGKLLGVMLDPSPFICCLVEGLDGDKAVVVQAPAEHSGEAPRTFIVVEARVQNGRLELRVEPT